MERDEALRQQLDQREQAVAEAHAAKNASIALLVDAAAAIEEELSEKQACVCAAAAAAPLTPMLPAAH